MEKLKPKLFSVMKTYTKEQFFKDVIAGIIVAIIALPLSIALALASGVTPEKGIYTAIIAGFVISVLGGSTIQIAGPTAAFATIVAGIVGIDMNMGISDSNEEDACMKKAIFSAADRKILAIDSTKFNRRSFVKVFSVSDVDTVVTDEKPSDEWIEFFEKNQVELIYG